MPNPPISKIQPIYPSQPSTSSAATPLPLNSSAQGPINGHGPDNQQQALSGGRIAPSEGVPGSVTSTFATYPPPMTSYSPLTMTTQDHSGKQTPSTTAFDLGEPNPAYASTKAVDVTGVTSAMPPLSQGKYILYTFLLTLFQLYL